MEAPILGSERYGRADGADLVTSGKVSVGVARTLLHSLIWVPPSGNRARRAPHLVHAVQHTNRFIPEEEKAIDVDVERHGFAYTSTVLCVSKYTPSTLVLVTITFFYSQRRTSTLL